MKNTRSQINIQSLFLDSWHPYAWLAAAGFALYAQTLFFGLSGYDDTLLITRHFYLIKDISKFPAAFLNDVAWGQSQQFYRPMLTLSFMFNAIVGGKNVWFYHLTNVLLHLGSVLLVFRLLQRMTGLKGMSFVLSLVFTVHPALSPAVAWLPGRNDPLLAVLVLGSLEALLEYLEKRRWPWLILHLVLLLGGLFAKETAAVAPALFLLMVMLIQGRPGLRKTLVPSVGWLASLLLYFGLRIGVLAPITPAMNTGAENALGMLGYLGKLLVPFRLSVMPMPQDYPVFLGITVLAGIVILFLLKGVRNARVFWAGLAWFLVFLAPTVFRITGFPNMLEHRLYLPMPGLLLMVSQAEALHRFPRFSLLLAAVLVPVFSVFSLLHSRDFRDPRAFWGNAVRTSPHCALAHRSLGMMHLDKKDPAAAAAVFEAGLRHSPDDPGLLNGLALAWLDLGRAGEALETLKKAVALEPENPFSHDNLGNAWLRAGQTEEARREYRLAYLLKPDDPRISLNLSYTHFLCGGADSARHYYQLAVANGLARDEGIERKLDIKY